MTRVARQLAAAIQTMRDACDQAERTSALADDRAVRRVLHELTWGLANASSSIEGALNALKDERAILAAGSVRSAERWRKLRACGGWPETEMAMLGATPEDFDKLADSLP